MMWGHGTTVKLELEPTLIAPRVARTAIQELLVKSPHDFVADAMLLTSELVTNAVLHTGAGFTLNAEFDAELHALRVEVADRSTYAPVIAPVPSSKLIGGHGLRIVAAIAQRWGVAETDHGKVVWFELAN